ncbi:MAG TPA: response regulator [Polyangiaceae bacterium]|nr:response regulator [Polyangiaceae bacterium]
MASNCSGCLVEEDPCLRAGLSVIRQTGKSNTPMSERTRISIVDDDESCRESLHALLKSLDFDVQIFTSAEELLASQAWLGCACLVVDATLPGVSGPELQAQLRAENRSVPLIFVTGYDDDELKKRVLTAGAIDCLCKPYEEEALLSSLEKATGVRVAFSPRAAP